MSITPVPGPPVPTGTVIHPALEMFADADDPDTLADLHLLSGLTVKFTPEVKAAVWHAASGDVSLKPSVVVGKYNDAGNLVLLRKDSTPSTVEGVRLAITDDPLLEPSGWKWRAEWDNAAFPSGSFSLSATPALNLSSVILGGLITSATPTLLAQLVAAADATRQESADLRAAIVAGGTADWETLTSKPLVIASGDTKALARGKIDAIAATDLPAAPTKTSLGLGSVDNTADANKPVSTATQTALNRRVLVATGQPQEVSHGFYATGVAAPAVPPADGLLHFYYRGV